MATNDSGAVTGLPDERFDDIIAEYLRGVDSGTPPDQKQQELLARYPDLAAELRSAFAADREMERRVVPLRGGGLPAPAGPPQPEPDKVPYFGDYVELKKIGEGGMGVVYRARQLSLKRPVALKMIRARTWADDDEVSRFRKEAAAAANLKHSNIVAIHEIGVYQGRHYYSMDLIEGPALNQWLSDPVARPRRRPLGGRDRPGGAPRRTCGASSTAISSPPTSCWTPRAIPTSPTSAWPS